MKKFIVLATLSLFIGQSVLAGQGGCQLGAANKNRLTPKAKIGDKEALLQQLKQLVVKRKKYKSLKLNQVLRIKKLVYLLININF